MKMRNTVGTGRLNGFSFAAPVLVDLLFNERARRMFLCCVFISTHSCTAPEERMPPGTVGTDTLVNVLSDIHLEHATGTLTYEVDTAYTGRTDSILCSERGLDPERLKRTMEWYREHPEDLSKLYEAVINELSRRQSEARSDSAR